MGGVVPEGSGIGWFCGRGNHGGHGRRG